MPQLDISLKRDFFIENLLFHRARKLYFWMVSFLGKLTRAHGGCYKKMHSRADREVSPPNGTTG